MKSTTAFVISFLIVHFSFSQDRKELLISLESTSVNSSKVILYQQLASSYRGIDYDSAFYFGNTGLKLAQDIAFEKGVGVMYNALGALHFSQSNYDSAIQLYSMAYKIALDRKDSLSQGALLNNVGVLYSYTTRYDTSLVILFKAREIRERIKDPKVSSTYNNIGLAYNRMGQLQDALSYYKLGAALKEEQGATLSLSNSYNNIGIILKNLDQFDSAIIYYRKSLAIAEQYDDKRKQANAHNNLGILYRRIKTELDLPTFHFTKAIALKEDLGDKVGLFNSYNNYAGFLNSKGQSYEALSIIKLAEDLDIESETNMHTYQGLLTKSEILNSLGKFEQAIQIRDSAIAIRFEEISAEKSKKIAELEVIFETEKKEAEIKRLSLENELKDSRILIGGISGGLVLLLLIVFFTLRHKKQKIEKEAQELQIDAMKKRFMELHSSPAELAVDLDFDDLNSKLHTPLTEREFDALKLSIEGKTNTEIGEKLFISVSTVKFHLRNTYGKMGVGNRKEAFQYMLKTS